MVLGVQLSVGMLPNTIKALSLIPTLGEADRGNTDTFFSRNIFLIFFHTLNMCLK